MQQINFMHPLYYFQSQNFSGCDELTATQHLLTAIHDGDLVRDGSDSDRKDKDHAAIPQHIARATHKDKV